MFAGAAALLLVGAFWIMVLHHRTKAGMVAFLVSAAIVSVASAEWFPIALSAALGFAAIALIIKDRHGLPGTSRARRDYRRGAT